MPDERTEEQNAQGRKISRVYDNIRFDRVDLKVYLGPRATRAAVIREVERVCGVMKSQEAAGKRVGLLLGHLLAMVQDREAFKPDYGTFEEYTMAIADKFGLSRATVRADLRIARALPDLDADQARRIPGANLTLVARAAKNTTAKKVKALLVKAEKTPIVEFRHEMEKRGLIHSKEEDADSVPLHLHVTRQLADGYRKFKGERTDDEALGELLGKQRRRAA